MTDGTTLPLDEIRGLVAERTRFETWLGTLEARRSATPAHVFERVWQDYDGRRQKAAEALRTHLQALQDEETRLASRHEEVTRTLGERRDAMAEVELRALVGEFDEDEGARRHREVEEAIAELEREVEGVGSELADVRGLVTQVRGREDEPAVAAPAEPVPVESLAPAASEPASAGTQGTPAITGVGVAPSDGPTGRFGSADAPRFPTPTDGLMVGESAGRETPTTGFAAQGLTQAARGVPTARQDDAAVGTATQKTLRCQECGAMNYPTEWYCERCGGELAAL
ncbi:hypothetical protein [Roseisolibacter agri]|uniref:Uncharacterized protein n=1 Tax=Roseisolibacter agri TaxID=2014610 RepID=A0AA37V1P0_9BACT|nr:hypothetical protein [Roseisolibacter agri]GLC26560.1 hypothetical protein rosag_30730 [Roseisolibacter agri]